MKKTVDIINNNLCVTYKFTDEHKQVLQQIVLNDGCAEFENRDPNIYEDVDGNSLSWKVCDELVVMGLLKEDEESFDVFYEITKDGLNIAKTLIIE